MVVLVALSGVTVAVMVTLLPTVRTPSVLLKAICSTFVVTVTLVSALRPSGTTPNEESVVPSGSEAAASSGASESAAESATSASEEATSSTTGFASALSAVAGISAVT